MTPLVSVTCHLLCVCVVEIVDKTVYPMRPILPLFLVGILDLIKQFSCIWSFCDAMNGHPGSLQSKARERRQAQWLF